MDPSGEGIRLGSPSNDGTGHAHSQWMVYADDTLPTQPYILVCIITEYQDGRDDSDNWCGDGPEGSRDDNDDIEDPRAAGCGALSITSPVPVTADEITVFVYMTHLDQSTGAVCAGTTGEVTMVGSD
ncbi:MAG: hypothetical protein KY455_09350 [Euryarchaeota archaeon]|nr:hypothetical protein [Euryarchaeota archaeon]